MWNVNEMPRGRGELSDDIMVLCGIDGWGNIADAYVVYLMVILSTVYLLSSN